MKHNSFYTLILVFTLFILIFNSCKNHTALSDQTTTNPDYKNYNFKKLGMDTSNGIPMGLEVGSEAPDFEFKNGDQLTRLSTELLDSQVLIMFYRGHWCPVCNRYLQSIEDSLYMLRDLGVKIIAIAPELEEYQSKTQDQTQTSIQLVSDSEFRIIDAYGVRFSTTEKYQNKIKFGLMENIGESNGGSSDLPVPATYLISRNQKVIYRQFDPNYKNRARVKDIIQFLNQKK